jgi:hypothetical protein
MTNIPRTQATDGVPSYLGRGDPDARRFGALLVPEFDRG